VHGEISVVRVKNAKKFSVVKEKTMRENVMELYFVRNYVNMSLTTEKY
jgi:hypothetical protein